MMDRMRSQAGTLSYTEVKSVISFRTKYYLANAPKTAGSANHGLVKIAMQPIS